MIVSIAGAASASFAALLGVLPGFPLLTYDSDGLTTYAGGLFNVTASPIAIRFSPTTPPRTVTPTPMGGFEVLTVNVLLDASGNLIGGVPTDDLLIRGEVDADGNGSIDYAGTLLTGEVLQFGHQDTLTPTDFFDFRFVPTGGSLLSFYTGKHIGVVVTSENSNFEGDFGLNFGGGAKGNVGPIDPLNNPPVCNAGADYVAECAGGITTVQLDATGSSDADDDPITYSWTSDCPGATFDDQHSQTPVMSVDTSNGCDIDCTVTLTVDDGNSPPVSCTAQVRIEDTNAPIIDCPDNLELQCGSSTVPADTGAATAVDDCDPNPEVTYSDSVMPGDCAQEMVITRRWTATDYCGQSDFCDQTISIVDTTKPTITCPPMKTVTCQQGTNPSVTGFPTVADNCDPAPAVTYHDDVDAGCCPIVSVITRTWTVTDACGNSKSCNQTIKVTDNSSPTVTCPPDITISCTQSRHPNTTGWGTATDSCDANPQVIYSDYWICTDCPKILKRKWKAKDDCGNYSSWCYQYITIADTQPPTITCPPNKTRYCGQSTNPCYTGFASATDNCDNCVSIWYTDAYSGSCPKTVTRTWKAKDDCNNLATCVQIINLIPQPPCPQNATYWKYNQSDWPVNHLVIGSANYNSTQLMNLLRGKKPNGQSAGSDVSVLLAKQLIAVEFNLLNGAPPDGIESLAEDAHEFLQSYPPGSCPTGWARNYANWLICQLEDYNDSEPNGCDDGC